MRIEKFSKLTIELFDSEIETMREIARLAHERLHASEAIRLRGVPLDRQAGLVGPELFHVKEMLERLGGVTGIALPYDPPGVTTGMTIPTTRSKA